MTAKSRADLNTDADNLLPDNTTQEISAEDVRQRVKDLADSTVNNTTDTGGNAVFHKGIGLQQQTRTIADDAAATITLPANCGSFILAISGSATATQGALMWCGTSAVRILAQFASVYESMDGVVLTGTTGTDVKVTVAFSAGVLSIENRLGSSRTFSLSFLANQ